MFKVLITKAYSTRNFSLAKPISLGRYYYRLGQMSKKVKSDFLFAQPSFASGAARSLDLWGQFDDYNISATPEEADAAAIASDWIIVGQDLCDAMKRSSESEQDAA
jgi:hypothetical protein